MVSGRRREIKRREKRQAHGKDSVYRHHTAAAAEQKMKGVKAVLQENELILKVDTQEDITLEKGFFQTSTEFFKEVYSITPVIRQKKKF